MKRVPRYSFNSKVIPDKAGYYVAHENYVELRKSLSIQTKVSKYLRNLLSLQIKEGILLRKRLEKLKTKGVKRG